MIVHHGLYGMDSSGKWYFDMECENMSHDDHGMQIINCGLI